MGDQWNWFKYDLKIIARLSAVGETPKFTSSVIPSEDEMPSYLQRFTATG